MMLKVKLTESHDWLRVAVVDADKIKLSLIMSHNRHSCTGTVPRPQMLAAFNAFEAVCGKKGFGTMGERMKAIQKVAQDSPSIDAYVVGLQTLASS